MRTPDNLNPTTPVERYKEHAPKITFLTLQQIEEQLKALDATPQLQAMVALYIYAGLRRDAGTSPARKVIATTPTTSPPISAPPTPRKLYNGPVSTSGIPSKVSLQ